MVSMIKVIISCIFFLKMKLQGGNLAVRGDYFLAMISISTFAPLGKSLTAKALLAG